MTNQVQAQHHIVSHDPATHTVENSTHPHHHQFQPSSNKKVPAAIIAVLGFILLTVGLVWYLNGQSFNFNRQTTEEFVLEPIDESIIAKVGVENIYGQDLKYKLSSYPENMHAQLSEGFKQQLIEESIILQAGAEADYIDLSKEVFNSVAKDQEQRSLLVEQVKQAVNNDAANVKGAYVSIWFMNYKPGPAGYEEGQRIALAKITELHQAVTLGQMTIKQAGEAIQRDTSLAQVDPQYKSNAYVEFNTKDKPDGLTFQPAFDQQLLALDVNQTTGIYTAQDYEMSDFNQPPKDALYMFGQILEKETDGGQSFNDWLTTQKQNYAVTQN